MRQYSVFSILFHTHTSLSTTEHNYKCIAVQIPLYSNQHYQVVSYGDNTVLTICIYLKVDDVNPNQPQDFAKYKAAFLRPCTRLAPRHRCATSKLRSPILRCASVQNVIS